MLERLFLEKNTSAKKTKTITPPSRNVTEGVTRLRTRLAASLHLVSHILQFFKPVAAVSMTKAFTWCTSFRETSSFVSLSGRCRVFDTASWNHGTEIGCADPGNIGSALGRWSAQLRPRVSEIWAESARPWELETPPRYAECSSLSRLVSPYIMCTVRCSSSYASDTDYYLCK